MKKLKRAVEAVVWFAVGMDRWIVATDVAYTRKLIPGAQDCVVVPKALWERAEKALRKKGKK